MLGRLRVAASHTAKESRSGRSLKSSGRRSVTSHGPRSPISSQTTRPSSSPRASKQPSAARTRSALRRRRSGPFDDSSRSFRDGPRSSSSSRTSTGRRRRCSSSSSISRTGPTTRPFCSSASRGQSCSTGGPDLIGAWGGVPTEYLKFVQQQTIATIVAAYAHQRPAQLWYGTAQSGVEGRNQYPEDQNPLLTNQMQGDPVGSNNTMDDELRASGEVFFTSAAADEDALESAEIRGSFFTHHMVSVLRCACPPRSRRCSRPAWTGSVRANARSSMRQRSPGRNSGAAQWRTCFPLRHAQASAPICSR